MDRPVTGEVSVGGRVGGEVCLVLVGLLVDGDVVVDPLVVIVYSNGQGLLGLLLSNDVRVEVFVNFLGVRGRLPLVRRLTLLHLLCVLELGSLILF